MQEPDNRITELFINEYKSEKSDSLAKFDRIAILLLTGLGITAICLLMLSAYLYI